MTLQYIETREALGQFCDSLRGVEWFAIDTEFLREKTYRPRLCLVQVGVPGNTACIDPLAVGDLSPLYALLHDESVTKVLHAAGQDLEIFYDLTGRVPAPIFDTQMAASLLGHADQIGYGNLVKAELGIELEKGHARTDWCSRPLSDAQLDYAANDVIYLCEVYQKQLTALEAQGRLGWLAEDFTALSVPTRYEVEPLAAWQKLKGAGKLNKALQLTTLQQLAAWREREAIEKNRPRRWIFKDDPLLDIARLRPKSLDELKRIRGIEEQTFSRHGKRLLEIVAEVGALDKDKLLQPVKPKRLPPESEPLVDLLMALMRQLCAEARVSTATLAGRRDLERLVVGSRDLPLCRGWRAEIAGRRLVALLDGELALSVADGQMRVEPR